MLLDYIDAAELHSVVFERNRELAPPPPIRCLQLETNQRVAVPVLVPVPVPVLVPVLVPVPVPVLVPVDLWQLF